MTTSSFESGIFDPMTGGEGQRARRRHGEGSRPAEGGKGGDAQAKRDAILNAFFDQDKSVSRERLRSAMRADPRLAVDFERTEAVLSEMNLRERAVGGPDVSQAVLARVDELQPYVAAPIRRQVSSARIAAVGAVLSGITLIVVLNQVRVSAPVAHLIDDEPRTVSAAGVAPSASSAPSRSPAASTKPVVRTAGLDGASKYETDRLGMSGGDLPSAGLDHRFLFHGGNDSGPGTYSSTLSPSALTASDRPALEWTSFLGFPVLIPQAVRNFDPAKAGKALVSDGASPASPH